MSLWVKICGLMDAESVATAIDAGADAIGLVFANSPRAVSIEQAIMLASLARGHASIVAVMRHPAADLAHEVQARVTPDLLQTDACDYADIGLLPGVNALPVYRDHDVVSADIAGLPARLLFEGRNSGHGETADWTMAASIATQREVILAGGLNPANVAAAITRVRPYGVDVSTGVERAPGEKDAERIREFVRVARAAAAKEF